MYFYYKHYFGGNMKLFNKSLKIVIFTLTVSLFFTACGITKKEDKNKGLEIKYETEENSKDETKERVKKEREEEKPCWKYGLLWKNGK